MSKREEELDILAGAINEVLQKIYGQKMGFALFMFTFGEEGRAGDYVSNGQKPDMIKFMRDVADRLEAGSAIGRTIGEA
jgi:hypothetical protein